ncbi:hypothetical protein JA1_004772 [Spathaspora sp. JA1]|nr:hypothetical protein JA1_004772 [Spathaspora sp. JA1]
MFKSTLVHVRHASKATRRRPSSKIQIQLLQDIPNLGVKGQLLMVQPAYMRNYLHHDNKACYTTDGPRIPVVAETIEVEKAVPAKQAVPKPTVPEQSAFTLSELSDLVGSLRSSKSQERTGPTLNIASEQTSEDYSITELQESLPEIYQLDSSVLPLDKAKLAELLFNITGSNIPVENIELSHYESPLKFISQVKTVGKYQMIISSESEKSSVTKLIQIK